jgi:hypothetical protein
VAGAALVKLQRPGEDWYVYFELVGFLNRMVFAAYNALAGEVWQGARHAELRLPRDLLKRIEAAPAALAGSARVEARALRRGC